MAYYTRLIDAELTAWKDKTRRKPLLMRGARQVGKSWAVRHLGESFKYYIEVNFEKRPEIMQVFEETTNVHTIVERLSAIYTTPVVPGETLLFLDEIQNVLRQSTVFGDSKRTFLNFTLSEQDPCWSLP